MKPHAVILRDDAGLRSHPAGQLTLKMTLVTIDARLVNCKFVMLNCKFVIVI